MTRVGFRRASRLFLPFLAAMFPMSGCVQRTTQKSASAPLTQRAEVPLPEWAPKSPSPEFLRAAKVLKPLPSEKLVGLVGAAEAARILRTYPAAWEFFGTLTDEQVHRFLTSKPVNMPGEESQASSRVLIPIKSLTQKQRAALDRYFEAYREAMKGTATPEEPSWIEERIVTFYHFGANEDLSNVDAGFNVAGHSVNITFRIHKRDGSVVSGFGCTIATI